MPALKNIRHEAFAQALVRATKTKMTNGQCYSASGYQAAGEAAEACAARLLSDVGQGVEKRVREIMDRGARAASVTVDSLLAELDRVMDGAISAEQFAAAKAAIDSKARLKGLFVDKIEVGGPNAFDKAMTRQDLVAAMLQETTVQAALAVLDELRDALEAEAGREAIVIPSPSIVPANANGAYTETRLAIEQARPRTKPRHR